MRVIPLAAFLAAAALLPAPAHGGDCPEARFVTPAEDQVLGDARAVIAFAPQPGRTGLRVTVEVRIPEKEVLQRIDTEVERDVLRLPAFGGLYRADVKVAAYSKCAGSTAAPARRRFHIDTGLSCKPPSDIHYEAPLLRWSREPGTDRVDVVFLDDEGARELGRESTTGSSIAPLQRDAIVVLRARCGRASSAPAFAAIRAPAS